MSVMPGRWTHVVAVGTAAGRLASIDPRFAEFVAPAAWLHDVGYSPGVSATGCHPLDGARFLQVREAPAELVSLVAYHSGAEFEAEERRLVGQLEAFERPPQLDLDILTLVDMTNGPSGEPLSVDERLREILSRYGPSDPVHRAVTRSSEYLGACCSRAQEFLASSKERMRVIL